MRALTVNQQLLQWLEQSRTNLESAIEGLTEEQMSRPVDESWSVKDHLTHVTVWDEMRFFEIGRIARGGEPSMLAKEEAELAWLNDGFAAERRRLPISQVLADMQFAHEMVKQAVAAAPEDRLDENLFGEVTAIGAVHEVDHAETIRNWRKREGI